MKDNKTLPECIEFEKELLQIDSGAVFQRILRDVSHKVWAAALKGCGAELICNRIFNNVSQNSFLYIYEDMNVMGDIRLRDILQAQKYILDTIDRLEREGEIVLWHRCKKAVDEITNHDLNNPKEPADFDISELEDGDLPF